MATNKIYRVSVRVRFEYSLFRDTFTFTDQTVFRDFPYDPRGCVFGLEPWMLEIKNEYPLTFVKFLTSPEVEIIVKPNNQK